jgi:hypothetical protein
MAEVQVKQEGEFKMKKPTKPKNLVQEQKIVKVELKDQAPLDKPKEEVTKVVIPNEQKIEENAVQESSAEKVDVSNQSGDGKEVGERNAKGEDATQESQKEEVDSPIKLVEDEENNSGTTGMGGSNETTPPRLEQKEVLQETKAPELPEGIDKLIKFMQETGGTVQDYARLNADYSNVDSNTLLKEYYKQTKPHLDQEDIDILLDDFTYDEEIDEDRDIRKKKIAFKEEVAKAKNFLEETKGKYYEEIKLRPGITQEQQKAMDFFNRYNNEEQNRRSIIDRFEKTTDNYFSSNFEGFDFNVGSKKFKYSVKDPVSVADSQKNLSKFVETFLNDKGELQDPGGYHKALYAARNTDQLVNHFYEQGRADAIKEQIAKTKNITTEPRQTAGGDVFINGLKVRAISGADSSRLKIKTKKFN